VKDLSPLKDLPTVLRRVQIPVQIVGGLSIEQALEGIARGAGSLVIGAPLAIRPDSFAAGKEFKNILTNAVFRVKEVING
jgi:3-hexulose-6-phosphate synthase/6-phospho-3-hexuloisomerase